MTMTNYDNFSKTFASSRKNMKWEEIEYFFQCLKNTWNILDLGCGSGRLLERYKEYFGNYPKSYLGVDLSEALLSEAKNTFPKHDFEQGNMWNIEKIVKWKKFDFIFLIASFHHLNSWEERERVLLQLKNILTGTGKIFMTNWALESPVHKEKYKTSYRPGSKNIFWSKDFNIKFWKFDRYYHSFSLKELEYLWGKSGLQIQENRLFDTEKNIITILTK